MGITITPQGLLVRDYDGIRRRWHAELRSIEFRDLLRRTDIQLGTSMSDIFDLVAKSPQLMAVLQEACFVDLAALHERPRDGGTLIRSDFVKVISKPDTEIEEVLIERDVSFADDHSPSEWYPTSDWMTTRLGLTVNRSDWKVSLPLAKSMDEFIPLPEAAARLFPNRLADDEIFGGVVNLPLRLSTVVVRDEEMRVEMGFTLWELLVAIYGSFGQTPPFWDADQRRIEKLEEGNELMRRIFGNDKSVDSDE